MKRNILITGASAGLGAALAREYAQRGWNLILVARREERLQALAAELNQVHGTQSQVIATDLFSETAVPDLLRALNGCLLYTSPSPRDQRGSRMPSSA